MGRPLKYLEQPFNDDALDEEKEHDEYMIIKLWDNLPDYAKTQDTLNKIRSMSDSPILDRLSACKV